MCGAVTVQPASSQAHPSLVSQTPAAGLRPFPSPEPAMRVSASGLCPCQIALGRGLGHVCRTFPHHPHQPNSQASAGDRGASCPPPPVWLGALSLEGLDAVPGTSTGLAHSRCRRGRYNRARPSRTMAWGPSFGRRRREGPSSSGLPRSPSMLAVTRGPAKAPFEA